MTQTWLVALIILGCLTACSPVGLQEVDGCGAVASALVGKPPGEVIETFTRSDLDTKYQIYVCGNQWIHPPALYLAESFAVGGEAVAPFLKQKLAQTRSDTTVRDIITVYAAMRRQGTYDVRGDVELMKLMGDRVQAIRDEYWRKYCADILDTINNA
jgi:hypothetical protein